jgi:hypothetical protein
MMPFTSARRIPLKIPRHSVQAPGCPEHRQIQPGLGQGLQAQDPSKNPGSRLPETVQDTVGTSPVHITDPG